MVKASYEPVIARVLQPLTYSISVMVHYLGYIKHNQWRGNMNKEQLKTCISCGLRYNKNVLSDYCPSCDNYEPPVHNRSTNDNLGKTSTRLFSDDGGCTL